MGQIPTGGKRSLEAALAVGRDHVLYEVSHRLADGIQLDMLVRRASQSEGMLVLLPSAQSRRTRSNPIYHRWSWGEHFPKRDLVVISDPALYLADEVLGGWYMHPQRDLVAATASVLQSLTEAWGVPASQVALYGSSMGGFLAMMLAAHLPGCSAVAEIPQFDMREYEFPATLRILEKHLLRRPFEDHFQKFPEQVSVIERFRKVGHVPAITILTNMTDVSFAKAQSFVTDISDDAHLKQHHGPLRIAVVPEKPGHTALDFWQVRPALAAAMAEMDWRGKSRPTLDAPFVLEENEAFPLGGVLYPGYSTSDDVTLHVGERTAHLKSALRDGHRYIWGPHQDWAAGSGPYISEMAVDRDGPVMLAVSYFDQDRRQIACYFLKPGEPQEQQVPSETVSAAIGLRVSGRADCRLRLRR